MVISDLPINTQACKRGLFRIAPPITEFEVQAYLYWELLKIGYTVRGEVGVHKGKARFDLAIYNPSDLRYPIRIVEVKKRRGKAAQQSHRYYTDFGIPVDVIGGMKSAERYLAAIQKLLPL